MSSIELLAELGEISEITKSAYEFSVPKPFANQNHRAQIYTRQRILSGRPEHGTTVHYRQPVEIQIGKEVRLVRLGDKKAAQVDARKLGR